MLRRWSARRSIVSLWSLRIKFWHLVLCFVWVPSMTLKGFHVVYSAKLSFDAEMTAIKQSLRRSFKRQHRCCVRDKPRDDRSAKSPRLFIVKVQYLTFKHRIRIEATGSMPGIQGTGCVTRSCLGGPIRIRRVVPNAAFTTDVCIDGEDVVVDATLYAEHGDPQLQRGRSSDLAERREEKNAGPADSLPGDPLQPLIRAYT